MYEMSDKFAKMMGAYIDVMSYCKEKVNVNLMLNDVIHLVVPKIILTFASVNKIKEN